MLGSFTHPSHLQYVHPPAASFSRFYVYCPVHVLQAPTQVLQRVQALLVYGSTSFVRDIGMAEVATGHFQKPCLDLVWIIGEITSTDVKACLRTGCINIAVVNAILMQYFSNVMVVLSSANF